MPLLVIQSCGVLIFVGLVLFWPGDWNALRVAGALLTLPAGILLLVARFQLGQSFAVTPQARELVTQGLYAKIRNPMYVFSWLMILGFALVVQNPYFFLIPAIIVVIQVMRARQESRVLEQKFGDNYRAYRAKTWF
jgi:protein-S-isoprenylcysteine O-methyltransferase Ste14